MQETARLAHCRGVLDDWAPRADVEQLGEGRWERRTAHCRALQCVLLYIKNIGRTNADFPWSPSSWEP